MTSLKIFLAAMALAASTSTCLMTGSAGVRAAALVPPIPQAAPRSAAHAPCKVEAGRASRPSMRVPSGWTASFAEACERARRERKHVLLLQMLGRLDEELC